jgi:hypothetical protein
VRHPRRDPATGREVIRELGRAGHGSSLRQKLHVGCPGCRGHEPCRWTRRHRTDSWRSGGRGTGPPFAVTACVWPGGRRAPVLISMMSSSLNGLLVTSLRSTAVTASPSRRLADRGTRPARQRCCPDCSLGCGGSRTPASVGYALSRRHLQPKSLRHQDAHDQRGSGPAHPSRHAAVWFEYARSLNPHGEHEAYPEQDCVGRVQPQLSHRYPGPSWFKLPRQPRSDRRGRRRPRT